MPSRHPDAWPPLPLDEWADTYRTLHMLTQIAGKVRLALAPRLNHWWHVPLYVSTRGLTTSPIPYNGDAFEVLFDFIDHRLRILVTDGSMREITLESRPIADFYALITRALADLGIDVKIWPMPVEVANPIRFDRDGSGVYDAEYAQRFWRILTKIVPVLAQFRGEFVGKASPVHFFWGSFDLAVTRFSGRVAPPRPDADSITREAYSHEASSTGFWPGGGVVEGAAFYAYSAPEPDGFGTSRIRPADAAYNAALGEFILPYEAVRTARQPAGALLEFLHSTYDAGADLAGWDRAALERPMMRQAGP